MVGSCREASFDVLIGLHGDVDCDIDGMPSGPCFATLALVQLRERVYVQHDIRNSHDVRDVLAIVAKGKSCVKTP